MKRADLVSISDLAPGAIETIWRSSEQEADRIDATVAWSFEGDGVRTRTTFIHAFRQLGLQFTELPHLLKTQERPEDLAGYLDPFYDIYVIREADHGRLEAFAQASSRPVINAMSRMGHPCEVLTDAYYIDRSICSLRSARICLWGPTTNVFRSWHELAAVLGFELLQVCAESFHQPDSSVRFMTEAPSAADIVITDAWPRNVAGSPLALTTQVLARMGSPVLLPTPPFTVGGELLFDPLTYPHFAGYAQKKLLVPIQKAVLRHCLAGESAPRAC